MMGSLTTQLDPPEPRYGCTDQCGRTTSAHIDAMPEWEEPVEMHELIFCLECANAYAMWADQY